MIDRALFVRIEAKEGKEDEVEDFLRKALDDVMEEEGTVDWDAVKFGARATSRSLTRSEARRAGWRISRARSAGP